MSYLIERAVPGCPDRRRQPPARREALSRRGSRDFHRSAQYERGAALRNTRDVRAIGARDPRTVAAVAAGHWAYAEFEAL